MQASRSQRLHCAIVHALRRQARNNFRVCVVPGRALFFAAPGTGFQAQGVQ
jgi:hypothetical protein